MTGQHAEQAGGDCRDIRNNPFIVAIGVTTEFKRDEAEVEVTRQVMFRGEHGNSHAGDGDQFHNQPVANQNAARHNRLAPNARIHHHQRGNAVGNGNALQHSGYAQGLGVEVEQIIVDQAEEEEDQEALDHVAVKLAAIGSFFHTPGQRKGQHHTDHEYEKGKNQVVEMEAHPGHVLELHIERLGGRVGPHLINRVDDSFSPRDPKHVESAQRVDGSDTLLHEWLHWRRITHGNLIF